MKISSSRLLSIKALGWLILLGTFAITWYYVDNYFHFRVDSDMASELVMGKLLAEEGSYVSENWYYSTVLEFFDVNLIWGSLFRITDDWHLVRTLGTMLMCLLVLACLYLACRFTGLGDWFGYIGALSLLPVSDVYFSMMVRGSYYFATFFSLFLLLGMWGLWITGGGGKALRLLAAGAAMAIAFLQSLEGPMVAVMVVLPMVAAGALAALVNKAKGSLDLLAVPLLSLGASGAGYIYGSLVLAENYSFTSYESMRFVDLDLDGMVQAFNGFLVCLGYRPGEELFSMAFLYSALAGLTLLGGLWCSIHILRRPGDYGPAAQVLGALCPSFMAVILAVFGLSSAGYVNRYTCLVVSCAYLAIFACLGLRKGRGRREELALLAVTALCLMNGALNYNDIRKIDETSGQREAAAALVEQGYYKGYATFWNANVITELSNGQLEVWHWSDGKTDIEDLKDINDIYPWLQAKSHLEAPPEGRIFILLSACEDYYMSFTQKLPDEYVIYRADNYYDYGYRDYIAYGFESYEELAALMG